MLHPTPDEDPLDPSNIADEPIREFTAEERSAEEAHARRLAERYRIEFLDMNRFRIDQELARRADPQIGERCLQAPRQRSGHLEHDVAPVIFVLRVPQPYVRHRHAARKAHVAVDDDGPPVIAPVKAGQLAELRRPEFLHFAAGGDQR